MSFKTINIRGTSISLEDTVKKISLDCKYPVGSSYIQYPMTKSPRELWGNFSTWEVVNFNGSFFRSEGTIVESDSTLKLEFMNGFEVVEAKREPWGDYTNDCVIATLKDNGDFSKIRLGMRMFPKYFDGWTIVRKIEAHTIYCNSAPQVNKGDIIYFGTVFATQTHKHGGQQMYEWSGTGNIPVAGGATGNFKVLDDGTTGTCTTDGYNEGYEQNNKLTRTHFITFGDGDYGETRAKNISVRVWRRTK